MSKNLPVQLSKERAEQVAVFVAAVCGFEIATAREFVRLETQRHNMNVICNACRILEDAVFDLADDAFWSCVTIGVPYGKVYKIVEDSPEAARAWEPFAGKS